MCPSHKKGKSMANGRVVFIILGILLGATGLLLFVRRFFVGTNRKIESSEPPSDIPTEELIVKAE